MERFASIFRFVVDYLEKEGRVIINFSLYIPCIGRLSNCMYRLSDDDFSGIEIFRCFNYL
jgi:hypothetical protein